MDLDSDSDRHECQKASVQVCTRKLDHVSDVAPSVSSLSCYLTSLTGRLQIPFELRIIPPYLQLTPWS